MTAEEYWMKYWKTFADMSPEFLDAVEIGLRANMEYEDWFKLFTFGSSNRYDTLFL